MGHNGCKRSVLGQLRKSLNMKSRGLPKSSQMRPGRLQNRFQDLSGVTPGPLPGALGGKSAFRSIFRCLLAAPGPLPGRSWGSPGPLLTPPGSLLGSLGALRGWFWELFALLLKALSENRGNLDCTTLFQVFFYGSGVPKSFQNRTKSLRGASWAPFGPPRGRQVPATGAPLNP